MTVKLNYAQGLEDAARQLERTARQIDSMSEDCQQILDRLKRNKNPTPNERREMSSFRERISLLNGQAHHIRKLNG